MAVKIGIAGQFNTGKSYARRSFKHGENVFVLMPTAKAVHLTDSEGKPVQPFMINGKEMRRIRVEKNAPVSKLLPIIGKQFEEGKTKVTGNFVVEKDLDNLPHWIEFVDLYMPHIKTLILPDFTHFVSHVLADDNFIKRKQGGEAYQRLT